MMINMHHFEYNERMVKHLLIYGMALGFIMMSCIPLFFSSRPKPVSNNQHTYKGLGLWIS